MKDFKRTGFAGAIKQGGGFLNNVDGTITGYEFTAVPPNGKEGGEWLYFVPTIKVDGADEEVSQHFFLGAAEDFEISKDGQSLSRDGGVSFGAKTPFGRLLMSMLANGLDESDLPDLEGGDDMELSALVDKRYRFIQEIDEEANRKLGKRKVKDKKTKKTVEYNRTNTLVSKVYGEAAEGGKKSSTKPSSKKAKDEDEGDDLSTEADAVVADILSDNDGEVERGKLSLKLTTALMKNKNREALKKLILSDDYLTSDDREKVFTLEGKGSKQKLVAA